MADDYRTTRLTITEVNGEIKAITSSGGMVGYNDFEFSKEKLDDFEEFFLRCIERIRFVRDSEEYDETRAYIIEKYGKLL